MLRDQWNSAVIGDLIPHARSRDSVTHRPSSRYED